MIIPIPVDETINRTIDLHFLNRNVTTKKILTKTNMKILITGIAGQDGSFLAEEHLALGDSVSGIIRKHSISENQTNRLDLILKRLDLHYGDLLDFSSLCRIITKVQPDIIYNLAALSHVGASFEQPILTAEINSIGYLNLLEAVRLINPKIKIYQACSSEQFGHSVDSDGCQRESTPMNPVSPYGCAKLFSYQIGINYRNSYNMFITNGIAFNHESTRRGSSFVTNKIAKEAIEVIKGKRDYISLGNLDATRDWSHAKDVVRAMRLLMAQDKPTDCVIASGVSHSIRGLCSEVFQYVNTLYKTNLTIKKDVKQDEKFFRPEEQVTVCGDYSKLYMLTQWTQTYTFRSMLHEMVNFWANKYE